MSELRSFFLFCSGANHSILNRTPTDVNKYAGIGATIFFTGVFAALAGAYALYTVFNSYLIAISFGVLWGLMIFNLDRYIVSTLKKKGSFWKDLGTSLPRVALAILIATVIAKPLELKIFDSEIQSELVLMQQENYQKQDDLLKARYTADLETAKSELATLKSEIKEQAALRDRLNAEAIAEADGTGGSMQRNLGPIYKAKRRDAQNAEDALIALEATNEPLIDAKLETIASIEKARDDDMAALDRVALTGFAARMEALERIGSRSHIIYMAGLFIMLLFIAIETAPIFVKLITARSPYDYVLDKHEHAVAMNHKSITTVLSHATENNLHFDYETGKYKTQLAIKAEKEIADQAIANQIEQLKQKPITWRDLLKKRKIMDYS